MKFLGGGERLCCDTIRVLLLMGHEVTLLSQGFDTKKTESFFGYEGLFDKTVLADYAPSQRSPSFGTPSHLIHHTRGQNRVLSCLADKDPRPFNLIFSTQDPGYIPNLSVPVFQWGYFPRYFPDFSPSWLASLPLRSYYQQKIARIGLVLAISQYSRSHLDPKWNRPSIVVYPACNMVQPRPKRDLIVTVGRAIPAKRLELFWQIAKVLPEYEFVMLLTQDPLLIDYSLKLSKSAPANGRAIFNPSKETYHKFLGEARGYLHLMQGEHFGITIVEAMSANAIPVVHDSGGPKEIVEEGIGFRWKSIEDVPDLLREAVTISTNSESRRRAERFSFEMFEKRLSGIFSGLRV